MRSNSVSGFTLTELLVVVGIVGLLAAAGYPSYRFSILRSHRADAMAAVLRVQMAQEKFRANCPFYAQSLGTSNVCGSSAAASVLQAPSASASGYYAISIVAESASGNSYALSAMPTGTQASDTLCAPMTLTVTAANPQGLKAPGGCW